MISEVRASDACFLENEEFDFFYIQSTVFVIYLAHALSNLVGQVNILLEFTVHRRVALANATPSLDFLPFKLAFPGLELNSWLSYHDDLLVLHCFIILESVHLDLSLVLDLTLSFGSIFIFEVTR